MSAKQQYACALCSRKDKLYVDHDHATGKVRGLLCKLCNWGLGSFSDNAAVLRRAADYVSGVLHPASVGPGPANTAIAAREPYDTSTPPYDGNPVANAEQLNALEAWVTATVSASKN